jgi:pimeloyl-ACP methyl ester carboxylesterase
MLVRSFVTLVAVLQASSWVDPARHQIQMVNVADGVQLEVLDFGGTGRPIVLLAGFGNTAHVYDGLAPKLTGAGHVYAVTRRGYGVSSRPQSGYDVSRLGEDVLAVIEALRLEKPVLVGHSMAGQELSYLASEHQDRIAGLVYLDAAYRYAYDVPGEFEKDFPSLPSPPATPPAVTRPPFTLPEAERRQPRGETTAREAILAGGRQFTKIGLPVLAIFASPHDTGAATPDPEFDRFDEAVTERQARAFERGVPGARVLRWPRASHYLFLTRPADVIEEVTRFIAGLR